MILLAHRGLWRTPQEKNSRQSFRDAFAGGYGVELDVRDAGGALVISHDPVDPARAPLMFGDVLADYAAAGMPGRIAINVKADGLSAMIGQRWTPSRALPPKASCSTCRCPSLSVMSAPT